MYQPGDISGTNDGLQFKSTFRPLHRSLPVLSLCMVGLAGRDMFQVKGLRLTSTAFLGSERSPGPTSSGAQAHSETSTVPFSPFNIAYYQSYFDVDTNTVLKRVGLSILPRPNFIAVACNGSIDLYGEFRSCW